jgi:hypothetical protein
LLGLAKLTYPLAVFILLLMAILLLRKNRCGIPLDKEEKNLAYAGLIIGSFIGLVGITLQFFEYFGVTPSFLQPYAPLIIDVFLVAGIFALFGIIWVLIKRRKSKKPIYSINQKSDVETEKLAIYAPIHTMIVRVNHEFSRVQALQMSIGSFVPASSIDFNTISAVFNNHSDKFTDKDLKMWIEIEKEIKSIKGFYLYKARQEWFDDLETRHKH